MVGVLTVIVMAPSGQHNYKIVLLGEGKDMSGLHTNQPDLLCDGRLCREELDSVAVCGGQVQHLPLDDFTGVYSSQSPTHQGGEEIYIH